MNTVDKLKAIINANLYDLWSLAANVLDYIYSSEKDDQVGIFSSFLKDISINDFDIPTLNQDNQFSLSDEHFQRFKDVLLTIERIIQNMVSANVIESDFYEKIWNKMNDPDLFPDYDDRIALLLALWLDVRIPYYQLGESCSMENDEYQWTIQQISPELKKARFIIYANIQQKTQRASLLMKLGDSIKDYKQRVVFWSHVFTILSNKEAMSLMKEQITDKLSTTET